MTFADLSAEPLARLVSLAGRGVIITGGGQGLGFAIAPRAVEANCAAPPQRIGGFAAGTNS